MKMVERTIVYWIHFQLVLLLHLLKLLSLFHTQEIDSKGGTALDPNLVWGRIGLGKTPNSALSWLCDFGKLRNLQTL